MNILDVLEYDGEDNLKNMLSSFSCPQNAEIDSFLKINSLNFARRKLSITYLVFDENDGEILGYFTLAHKAIEIKNDNISNTTRRKLSSVQGWIPTPILLPLLHFCLRRSGRIMASRMENAFPAAN